MNIQPVMTQSKLGLIQEVMSMLEKVMMCQLGLTQAVLTPKTLNTPLRPGGLHGNDALQTDMVLISLIDFYQSKRTLSP